MINKLKNFVDGAAQIASSENWDEGRAQEFIFELAELKPEFDRYIQESIEEEESAKCINKQLEDWFERNSLEGLCDECIKKNNHKYVFRI